MGIRAADANFARGTDTVESVDGEGDLDYVGNVLDG